MDRVTGRPVAKTRVIAHRGASHGCPENTLSAFDAAMAEGADGMELDLQLTRDGVPVVYHDKTLSKLGLKHKRIAQMRLAELRILDAGKWFGPHFRGEPVPTLGQVLERYAARTELCLELKPTEGKTGGVRHIDLVRQTVGLVRDAGAQDKVYLLCFDAGLLQVAHRLAPELRTVLNAVSPAKAMKALPGMPWLFAVDVDIRRLRAPDGPRLRGSRRRLMSYTCDSEADLAKARAAGVEFIISNRPAWVRERLSNLPGPG